MKRVIKMVIFKGKQKTDKEVKKEKQEKEFQEFIRKENLRLYMNELITNLKADEATDMILSNYGMLIKYKVGDSVKAGEFFIYQGDVYFCQKATTIEKNNEPTDKNNNNFTLVGNYSDVKIVEEKEKQKEKEKEKEKEKDVNSIKI